MNRKHHLGLLNVLNVCWMGQNRLKLNADKTQLIWLGTRQQLAKRTIKQLKLTTSTVEFDAEANDLGVLFWTDSCR